MPSDDRTLAFGDVVLVSFPFTDQSATKRRPAVVISSLGYNSERPDIILMPITSQLRPDTRPGDVPVTAWQAAGLLKPSAVKPLIATLERSIIIRQLGSLEADDRDALRQALSHILG